jgi:large subunit ribosomal protein L17
MNHKNGFNPLSRTTAHRRAMSRNMVTSLFRFERITTTKSKALEVRKDAEKLITRAKIDTVHNRRIVAKYIQDDKILGKLFTEIGPRMKDRKGGYTRVLKIGFRQGDAADMVILELVDYKLPTEEDKTKKAAKTKKAEPDANGSVAEKKAEPKAKKSAAKPASEEKSDAGKKAPAKAAATKAKTAKKAAPAADKAAK